MTLANRALLVHFTAPIWNPTAKDENAASALERSNGTASSMVRVYKTILKSPSLKDLQKIRTDTYQKVHRKYTLPWIYNGPAILPSDLYTTYREHMLSAQDRELTLRERFYTEYPQLVENSRTDLGALYDPTLYPTLEELKTKFDFKFTSMPLPDSTDFRIQDPSLVDSYELVLESARVNAMRETYSRFGTAVEHMAERLALYDPNPEPNPDGTKGRIKNPFHASMVENLKELVELLPSLNLTDDPQLAELAERAKEKLVYHDADSLRESDSIRLSVLDEAKAILAELPNWK